jgi:fumarate hydratase class II
VLLAAQAGQLELNVMMPVLAHNLFEMMQVTIGAVQAFTDRCVRGVLANREKAQSWLERNAIIVTALNPLIGYAAGAELVKESLARSQTVFEVARQRLEKGELRHRDGSRSVTEAELEAALGNLRRLTEGGIVG